jgi:hypothetical protein
MAMEDITYLSSYYWLFDVNCGPGSASAAFRKLSAFDEQNGGQAMHVYAVDSKESSVLSQQRIHGFLDRRFARPRC